MRAVAPPSLCLQFWDASHPAYAYYAYKRLLASINTRSHPKRYRDEFMLIAVFLSYRATLYVLIIAERCIASGNYNEKRSLFTMTLEFTNNPCRDSNPVEAFTKELIRDASHKHPKKKWIRVSADEVGGFDSFKLTDDRGCITILQIDSKDDNYAQLSLRCISSDGASVMTSTEWSINYCDDHPLKTLYALLDARISTRSDIPRSMEMHGPQKCVPLMEQLICCLAVDAITYRTVFWKPFANSGGLSSYRAKGNFGKSAQFWIIPERFDETGDEFTFLYELDGEEILSITQRAPTAACSLLRSLYQAIAGAI